MSKISLKTQNRRGGNPLWKSDLGYAAIFIDEEKNTIIADAFEGSGDSYRRREMSVIEISNGLKTYTFNSFEELFNKLER